MTVTLSGFAPAVREGVVVGETPVDVGSITMGLATLGETIVVSASKIETKLVDAPATMSVIGADTLASSPAQNFGDLLRAVPGMNVIQTSARDVQMTSRQATSTLSTSTLVLLDGRSIYMDFFGFVIWDLVPTNPADIKQVDVVRGPASAVWGANVLTGVVNIITKTPREAAGTSISLQAGSFNRDGGSREADGNGTAWGGGITLARARNDTWSFREPPFLTKVGALGKKKVILCGMETHVCVLQTCVGRLREGYDVHVVRDAVCSRTKDNYKTGIEFMRDAGAVITCTETVLFQLLEKAGTDEFKAIVKRIK